MIMESREAVRAKYYKCQETFIGNKWEKWIKIDK